MIAALRGHHRMIIRRHRLQVEAYNASTSPITHTITTWCRRRRINPTLPTIIGPSVLSSSVWLNVIEEEEEDASNHHHLHHHGRNSSILLLSCQRYRSWCSSTATLLVDGTSSSSSIHQQPIHRQQTRQWSDEPIPHSTKKRHQNNTGGRGGGANTSSGRGGTERMDGEGGRGGGSGRDADGTQQQGRNRRFQENPAKVSNVQQEQQQEASPTTASITVANTKGGGGGTYCYGCGVTIVKRSEQHQNENSKVIINKRRQQQIRMGIETKKGGYWNEKKRELEISKIKNWGLCVRCRNLLPKKKNKKKSNNDDDNDNDNDDGPGDEQLESLSPSHEMTLVFREQVSKLRQKKDAVVVLCVDAINVRGSLIRTLRNYVGGNPILLAVTRCDLLPQYVQEACTRWSSSHEKVQTQIESFFMQQASELNPAGVYLCSVRDDQYNDDGDEEEIFNGTQQLAQDLWDYLDGRDPYIVGAANIGKSTLTDRLIDDFVRRQQEPDNRHNQNNRRTSRQQRDNKSRGRSQDSRRLETILESRVTKSSLPGTTLQNVRVPCFPDYTQALWDTPGLLLDPSLAHYPIRNFRRIKARRPAQIKPQWHDVNERSFALLIYEKEGSNSTSFDGKSEEDEPVPLLRIEIRLKREEQDKQKAAKDPGPVRLVWNSILDVLSTDVQSIEKAQGDEKKRMEEFEVVNNQRKESERKKQQRAATTERTPKDKEQKRREYQKRIKAEKKELGAKEWHEREEGRREEQFQIRRLKALAHLQHKVFQEEMPGGKAMEIDVEHFGYLGIMTPRAALVRVFAPSNGIRPTSHPAMIVPPRWWEDEIRPITRDARSYGDDNEHDDWKDEHDFDEKDYEDDDDECDDFGLYASAFDDDFEENSFLQRSNSAFIRPKKRWTELSGEKVGWVFGKNNNVRDQETLDGWNPIGEVN